MSFQTRNEIGLLKFYKTLEKAIKQYDKDNSIWKISYSVESGKKYRWRPKFKNELWDNEDRLNELSNEYKNANENELFWINQPLDHIYHDFLNKCFREQFENCSIFENDDEIETAASRIAIKNVISDNDFRNIEFMKQFLS